MNKYILILLLASSTLYAIGSDGTNGDPVTSSEPATELYCFKTGSDGSSGEKTGSDGSQGNKGQIVCVIKEKT
jgi:hypothetical protein